MNAREELERIIFALTTNEIISVKVGWREWISCIAQAILDAGYHKHKKDESCEHQGEIKRGICLECGEEI